MKSYDFITRYLHVCYFAVLFIILIYNYVVPEFVIGGIIDVKYQGSR